MLLRKGVSTPRSSTAFGTSRPSVVEPQHVPCPTFTRQRSGPLGFKSSVDEICHPRSPRNLLSIPCAVSTSAPSPVADTGMEFPMQDKETRKGPKILIAGAGIGGLVLAVALLKKGFDVKIFERDLTAIRGEGKYRGPIQVQSNALAALEAIDKEVAEQVLAQGCVTGDRINGLCDGLTGHWYVKFDTFHPAVDKGLPVTRVISRFILQKLLAEACEREAGDSIIQNDSVVCDFEEKVDEMGIKRVWAILNDGRRYEGDILIGADGIWSKVRTKLVGSNPPTYSQYTCYTGISDFTPPDIDTVGYRVFLGNGKYFVSSDVGDGKMQWYGFHKEPEGGKDVAGQKKERLLDIFGTWTDMVTDLIKATPEEDVLRRDIFDRPPVFRWTQGHVALLGDSAHAMQPNLGQGGCMAIEDGYCLANDLSQAVAKGGKLDLEQVLKGYQNKRMMRASTIHGLAGSAAIMASTYKAYLGEGLGPLGEWLQQLKIPHPGKVGGYVAMNLVMPAMLSWVLGGNLRVFKESDRRPLCHINDKPKHFAEQDFRKFLKDDGALLRAADARWLLVPSQTASLEHSRAINGAGPHASDSDDEAPMQVHLGTGTHIHGLRIALPEEALEITEDGGLLVGRSEDCHVVLDAPSVCARHAQLIKDGGDFFVKDLGSQEGTWLNGQRVRGNGGARVVPGDEIEFGSRGVAALTYRIKMCHRSVWDQLNAEDTNGVPLKVPTASRTSEEPEPVAA